jgi:hypothetical protein
MSQVIRARPLRRWEHARVQLDRWLNNVRSQAMVVVTFLVAVGLGMVAVTLLAGH